MIDERRIPRRFDMDFDVIWRFEFRKRPLFDDGLPDLLQYKGWILFLLGHCSGKRALRLCDLGLGESLSKPTGTGL